MSKRKVAAAKSRQAAKTRALAKVRAEAVEVQQLEDRSTPATDSARRLPSLIKLRDAALTFGAIAGVLCFLFAALALAFDVQPVVFRSGSMAPAINTGALAFSKTVVAGELAVGDVVTVKTDAGIRVTHRIENITLKNEEAALTLRGDANTVPDERAYVVKSADRIIFDIPKAGYVVNAISGPVGIFAGGLLVGLLLLTAYGPNSRAKAPALRHAWQMSVVAIVIGTNWSGVATQQTEAYFTDTATMTTGTFKSGIWDVPVVVPSLGCVNADGNNSSSTAVTLSWQRNAGYSYRIVITPLPPQNSYGSPTLLGSSQTGAKMTTNISGDDFTPGQFEAKIQAKLTTPVNPNNSNWTETGTTVKFTAGNSGKSFKLHCG